MPRIRYTITGIIRIKTVITIHTLNTNWFSKLNAQFPERIAESAPQNIDKIKFQNKIFFKTRNKTVFLSEGNKRWKNKVYPNTPPQEIKLPIGIELPFITERVNISALNRTMNTGANTRMIANISLLFFQSMILND